MSESKANEPMTLAALIAGLDDGAYETFWRRMLREYDAVCAELDNDTTKNEDAND